MDEITPIISKPRKPRRNGRIDPKLVAKDYALTTTAAILAGKELPGSADISHLNTHISRRTRAQIAALIGPDPDQFRRDLANQLLVTARECADFILRDLPNQKPDTRAFTLCALVDKSEQLNAKLASSPASAGVRDAVNLTLSGDIRSQILIQLAPGPGSGAEQQSPQLNNTSQNEPLDAAKVDS